VHNASLKCVKFNACHIIVCRPWWFNHGAYRYLYHQHQHQHHRLMIRWSTTTLDTDVVIPACRRSLSVLHAAAVDLGFKFKPSRANVHSQCKQDKQSLASSLSVLWPSSAAVSSTRFVCLVWPGYIAFNAIFSKTGRCAREPVISSLLRSIMCAHFIVCCWDMPVIGPTNSVNWIYINPYFDETLSHRIT